MATFQPRVCYHDLSAAVEFLERTFGFEPVMIATREGEVISAELACGDSKVQIGGAWENIKPPSALGGANTQTLYVELNGGVDAHCERARAAGAVIIQEPTDMFHGDRTYRALDPQGHMWIFGQKIREVTIEELEAAVPGMKVTRRT
jgi:uncharacterized glyoxalase superfamily protein PhnB